jgi:hypothetical protein
MTPEMTHADVTDRGSATGDGGHAELNAAFHRAAQIHPAERVQRSLSFAGRPALLDVVGGDLFTRLFPTFAHLQTAATHSHRVTISAWDASLTGVAAQPCAEQAQLGWEREDWSLRSYGGPTAEGGPHRFLREARAGRVACLDRLGNHLVVAYDSADHVTLHEQGRPVTRLVSQIYRGLGVGLIHAGLVADDTVGALLVGPSGSGKTALTLDCVLGGLRYLADDVAGLERCSDGSIAGHSIYGSANVLPFHLARHPVLSGRIRRDASQDKGLLPASAFTSGGTAVSTAITTILEARPGGAARTRIRPLARRDALPLLFPATPEHRHAGFDDRDAQRLAALVKRADCYRIEAGGDPGEVAHAVRGLLERNGRMR